MEADLSQLEGKGYTTRRWSSDQKQDIVYVRLPSPVPVLTEIVPPDVVAPVPEMSLLAVGEH